MVLLAWLRRLDFIRYLVIFLICLNAAAVLGIFFNYTGENLQMSVSASVIAGVETGYRLLASLILAGVAGSLIFMLRSLVNEKPSRTYLVSLGVVWAVLMLGLPSHAQQ